MVTAKTTTPDRAGIEEILEDFLVDGSGEAIDVGSRASRRDTQRDRRESSRRVSSFDERDAVIKRRVRSEQSRNRKQDRDASRATAEINREAEARDDWLEEQAAVRVQYRHGQWFDRRRL